MRFSVGISGSRLVEIDAAPGTSLRGRVRVPHERRDDTMIEQLPAFGATGTLANQ
jgi:hypothetical protein